ncbi:hypothetical protein A374_16708 [Fictibacillus macauensis ZFHKF-1]|uniref:Uncharacterized protein n=1 Tax=Fictibacillus macauensis ZFHKF-1 TaxID=1196324 RepID=I8UBL9_9BACL|nr:anti-sigma-F factor Fin family protein [Fictibacillus macauensis]EIT84183.1 hypothetical protein A374_16708 [Fictibacillus macauensis ZFHKF-1]
MSIHYQCRHCGQHMGSLHELDVTSEQLGFHQLTVEERNEMLAYDEVGNVHVKIICEDCHEALTQNPDYYELDRWIQ